MSRVRIDRRTALKWVAAAMTAQAAAACGREETERARALADLGAARPVSGAGYGTDPNLVEPTVPWDRTMSEGQLRVASSLADMILPAEEDAPAASAVGVSDFIDEWVSAPYPEQQADRETVLEGLSWIEQESLDRFGKGFSEATDEERAQILDDIAWSGRVRAGFDKAAQFFARFRVLVMSAYYASPEGMVEIGYLGNRPMGGAYPGPSEEALAHLRGVLAELGL